MKIKMFMAILVGICMTFIPTLTIFAEFDSTTVMIEKQQEVDKLIFEVKKDELADKGITITHTVPLENSIEVGVQPYNEETITYLNELLGKENVTIVDGQQAFTLTGNSEEFDLSKEEPTPEKNNSDFNSMYLYAAIIIIGGGIAVTILKKKA
jgi:hypothetical protein